MDRWCADFDNWGICDTVCFKLFDRTPLAWAKVAPWAQRREEFVRRGGFALLASPGAARQGGRRRAVPARACRSSSAARADERNFVKKGVSWALRSVGRRNATLNAAAVALAQRLAESPNAPTRAMAKPALKELSRAR